MGFRFYRRINFGSGFGINLGKRGASWSIRTKGGSFGSKGYSIKTPMKGLSFQKRIKKSYSIDSSSNKYLTGTRSRSSNVNLVLRMIIITALCIYSMTILWITVPIIVLVILFKIFTLSTQPQKFNQIITTVETPTQADIVIDKFLKNSQLLTLENICIEIDDFINDIYNEKTSNPYILQQYPTGQIRQLILHDICNLFHLLQTSLNDKSIEREIWFSIISYFSTKSISYTTIDEDSIRRQIQKMVAPDFFVHSDIHKNPFTVLLFLKEQNRPLYLKYKRLLNDYVTLITTIDFDLTINEKKLIQTMQRQ